MTLTIDKLVSQALEQGAAFDIDAAFASLSDMEKQMLAVEELARLIAEEANVLITDDEEAA